MNKCITCGVKGWFQGHCQKCRSKDISVKCNCVSSKDWPLIEHGKYCPLYEPTDRGKSFFDLTDKEKKKVLTKAAQQSNADQAELMAKSTDQKPIWEDRFDSEIYIPHWQSCDTLQLGPCDCERGGDILKLKQFIKEVETAAYERGKAVTPSCCYKECKRHEMIRVYNTVPKL